MNDLETIEKIKDNENRSLSNQRKIDELEQRQNNLDKLASAISVMDNEQRHIKSDIQEIKADVKTLTNIPSTR